MNLKQRNEIYQQAVDKWGAQAQMEMANEEATEFALAVRKQLRKNNDQSFANLVEEFADIEIMLEQVELMHSHLGFRDMINAQKEYKIKRLKKRLDEDSFEALPAFPGPAYRRKQQKPWRLPPNCG